MVLTVETRLEEACDEIPLKPSSIRRQGSNRKRWTKPRSRYNRSHWTRRTEEAVSLGNRELFSHDSVQQQRYSVVLWELMGPGAELQAPRRRTPALAPGMTQSNPV
ncbi:Acetamidase [Fusarium oxysporum f. sp. albedinis]|nr:Acetamidase [Fusarium oxysporum f. sp. albedinis]